MQKPTGSFHLHTTVPLPARIKQIDGLQILRAVAVALVTWGHAGLQLSSRLPDFGIFGIDIFFVISGFIMSYIVLNSDARPGIDASWRFFLRRLIRIYPIYWVFAALGMARLAHSHTPALHRYLASLLLFPHPRLPRIFDLSWTLMFEMFFYFLMAATLLFTARRAVWAVIVYFLIATLAGLFTGISRPLPAIACNPILIEFAYGALIALAFYRFRRRRACGIAFLTLGVAAALYLRAYPPHAATSMDMILTGQKIALRVATWGTAAALLVGGMVFWSPEIKNRIGLLSVILGNASYSAYLASTLLFEFVLRGLLKIAPPRRDHGPCGESPTFRSARPWRSCWSAG